jgi:arylformamidase
MVQWPGDPDVSIELISSIEAGERTNCSKMILTTHTGTHVDAPRHFLRGGRSIDVMPLEGVIGPARVVAIRHSTMITVAELRTHRIRRGERILFKTLGAGARWKQDEFDTSFVYIPADAAEYLVGRGVRAVGVDYLSVGGYKKDSLETHQALLRAGIWVIEGLDLSKVAPGRYDMVCLPLRIEGGDGSPVRVALRASSRSAA